VAATAKFNNSSTWFLKGATKPPPLLATSSALDDVYRSIYLSNSGSYAAVFMGFQADGMLQIYPGAADMSSYAALQYTCAATNATVIGIIAYYFKLALPMSVSGTLRPYRLSLS
jgi:hypothetical protein